MSEQAVPHQAEKHLLNIWIMISQPASVGTSETHLRLLLNKMVPVEVLASDRF